MCSVDVHAEAVVGNIVSLTWADKRKRVDLSVCYVLYVPGLQRGASSTGSNKDGKHSESS